MVHEGVQGDPQPEWKGGRGRGGGVKEEGGGAERVCVRMCLSPTDLLQEGVPPLYVLQSKQIATHLEHFYRDPERTEVQ